MAKLQSTFMVRIEDSWRPLHLLPLPALNHAALWCSACYSWIWLTCAALFNTGKSHSLGQSRQTWTPHVLRYIFSIKFQIKIKSNCFFLYKLECRNVLPGRSYFIIRCLNVNTKSNTCHISELDHIFKPNETYLCSTLQRNVTNSAPLHAAFTCQIVSYYLTWVIFMKTIRELNSIAPSCPSVRNIQTAVSSVKWAQKALPW